MQDQAHRLPRPYLSRGDTDERLEALGFEFSLNWQLKDTPQGRKMFTALQELIAGAIAEWAGVEAEPEDEGEDRLTMEDVNEELNTWAQEWLVG